MTNITQENEMPGSSQINMDPPSTMSDDDVLMMLEMTARAEREAGFNGYGKPPSQLYDACQRLVSAGFAEQHRFEPGWFRPTKAGADRIGHRIQRVS